MTNIMQSPGADLAPRQPAANAAALAENQRSIAEVQAAVLMAKHYPRDMAQAMDRIRMACQRPTLAAHAVYAYSRGGSEVTGPSIRLAESLANLYGNIQYGIREIAQEAGKSVVEAYAWDMETNVRSSKVFEVPHVRYTRTGGKKPLGDDPRDVYELVANNGARRMRACILAVIPADVVEFAVEECAATLKKNVELTPERIAKMLATFEELGVSKAMIEKRLQRLVDTITPAQFLHLGKIANALKDGIAKISDFFEAGGDRPAAPGPIRFTAAQMADTAAKIRQGEVRLSDVLDRFPGLVEDQVAELRAEVPKTPEAPAPIPEPNAGEPAPAAASEKGGKKSS